MNWGRRATLVPTAASLLLMVACSGTGESTPPRSRPPAATSSVNPGSVRGGSWVTYHGDKTRSGVARGPSIQNVQRTWTSPGLDGDIYAEPLTIGSRVIAATENDSVYALDASNGRVVWRTNLGTPVQSSTLPCGNISPTSGITSTPVADPSTGLIYAAAFLSPGRHELFALRERTGEVVWHRPIDPQGMDPLTQQLRSALTLANGRVYMAYGGLFGDCGDYHGWVAAVAADGTGPLLDYQVPTGNAGGIWAPSGPAVDDAGNLYVATGNSFSIGTFDFGDSTSSRRRTGRSSTRVTSISARLVRPCLRATGSSRSARRAWGTSWMPAPSAGSVVSSTHRRCARARSEERPPRSTGSIFPAPMEWSR